MPPFSATHAPARVLVVRLGALGDVVRTLPALRLMRRTWPHAEIAWAVEPGAAPLLLSHPDLDHVLVFDRRALTRGARRLSPEAVRLAFDFVRRLRAFRPDLALDFQGSLKSAVVARLSGAPARWGYAKRWTREGSHLLLTDRVTLPALRFHRVDQAAALARAAGAADGPLVADLALTARELAAGHAVRSALTPVRPAVALGPFSSVRQSWKRYPLERWAEVARALADYGAGVIVLGGPGEEAAADELIRRAGHPAVVASSRLAVRELAALIAACDLFVGGDTGPMHLAWASGVPVVAVYGPTDPVLNAPYGPGHSVLAPSAPTARTAADMFPGITPALIVEHASRQLAARRPLLESTS